MITAFIYYNALRSNPLPTHCENHCVHANPFEAGDGKVTGNIRGQSYGGSCCDQDYPPAGQQ